MIGSNTAIRSTSRPPLHNRTNFIENSLKEESKSFIEPALQAKKMKIGLYIQQQQNVQNIKSQNQEKSRMLRPLSNGKNWTYFAMTNKENQVPQTELEKQFQIDAQIHQRQKQIMKKAGMVAILPLIVNEKIKITQNKNQLKDILNKNDDSFFKEQPSLIAKSTTNAKTIEEPRTSRRPSSSKSGIKKIEPQIEEEPKTQAQSENISAESDQSEQSDIQYDDSEEEKEEKRGKSVTNSIKNNRNIKVTTIEPIKRSETFSQDKFVNNDVTIKTMKQRKHLDLSRWYCISRPQYKKSCGISSVVACWNYLFSTLSGNGQCEVLAQDRALQILGFKGPYDEIIFGTFTGNKTLMKWFMTLCNYFKVKGRCKILYKPKGSKNKTSSINSKEALKMIQEGLQNPGRAFIYHCYNHYMVPVGFEDMPTKPELTFKKDLDKTQIEPWIIVADNSRKHQSFHCIKWEDIDQDLNLENPQYIDIRNLQKGVQSKLSAEYKGRSKKGKNSHCIIEFTSVKGK